VDGRNRSQSIVASEPQRQAHTHRIQSEYHIAHVLDPAPCNQPGVISIPHTAVGSSQSAGDLAQNELSPSTSAIVPLKKQHSVLQGMEFIDGKPNLQLVSNYMGMTPGATFVLLSMCDNLWLIDLWLVNGHLVNQSWAVYDPNAEPTSGLGR